MDIRRVEAERFAEEIGAVLWRGRCDRRINIGIICNWPLMCMKNQDIPFCAMCECRRKFIDCAQYWLDALKRNGHFHHLPNNETVYCEEKHEAKGA